MKFLEIHTCKNSDILILIKITSLEWLSQQTQIWPTSIQTVYSTVAMNQMGLKYHVRLSTTKIYGR